MRILSVRKGLEIDHSESDYIYEAYYEWLEENDHFSSFFTDLKLFFEKFDRNWDEELTYDIFFDIDLIKEKISDLNLNIQDLWYEFEIFFWEHNKDGNQIYFLTQLGLNKTTSHIYYKYGDVIDIFKTNNPFILFSEKIGINFPNILDLKYPFNTKFEKEIITINNPTECLAFLLIISSSVYEEHDSFIEKFLSYTILPQNWDENLGDLSDSKASFVSRMEDFRLIENELNFFVFKNGVKDQLIELNRNLFGDISTFDIIEFFGCIPKNYSKTVNSFINWMRKLNEFMKDMGLFINDINKEVERLDSLISVNLKSDEILNSEQIRQREFLKDYEYRDFPYYFFHQVRKLEEKDRVLANLDQLLSNEIPSLSINSKKLILTQLGDKISKTLFKIGQIENAIVLAINSGAFLTAAELYQEIGYNLEEKGMKYRYTKGLEPMTSNLIKNNDIKAIPIIIDLFPHPKDQVSIAMIQINIDDTYFEKANDKSVFYLKKEKEQIIYNLISSGLEKIRDKKIDFVILPELAISFSPESNYYFEKTDSPLRKLLIEQAFVKKRIIIPGTFYLDRQNLAPIIFPTMEIIYVIKNILSAEEDSGVPGMGVIKGALTPLFHTNFGKFAVLICRDLLDGKILQPVLDLKPDIIFNPCANKDIERFNKESSSIVDNNNLFIVQPNLFYNQEFENSSSIYSVLNKIHLDDFEKKGFKKTNEPTEVYSSKKHVNEIVIIELNLAFKRILKPSIGSDISNIPMRLKEIIILSDIDA